LEEAREEADFKALCQPMESGPYHLFLSLDDLPVVIFFMHSRFAFSFFFQT
jgi:hypothetical protein